jgi:hypothetical protein
MKPVFRLHIELIILSRTQGVFEERLDFCLCGIQTRCQSREKMLDCSDVL